MTADDAVRPLPVAPPAGHEAGSGAGGTTDDELLRAFVSRGDHAAFRALVERHTPIVFAAARRQVRGDAHLAEDVTQAVFILLARRAGSLRRRGAGTLGGWLVKAARLSAQAAVRSDMRRRRREERAATMNPTAPETAAPATSAAEAAEFEQSVDEALCRLSEKDRAAVTLRYLQGRSQREVAQAMGVSEPAAAQRLSRAIAKLRRFFVRHSEMLALTPAGVEQLLARLAPPPPGGTAVEATAALARAAADAALLSPHAAAAGAPAAAAIARAVLAAMYRKLAGAVAAAVMLGLLLSFGARALTNESRRTGTSPAAAAAGPTAASQRPPIRVGVFVSATTGVSARPDANAWFIQFRITEELTGLADVQLVPLIEPDTAKLAKQNEMLLKYFPGKAPLPVTSAAALGDLDVIVASGAHDVPIPVLEAIEGAVREGTGLYVRGCLGGCKPGFGSATARHLRGYVDGLALVTRKPVPCKVVTAHPILGSLTSWNDGSLKIQPIGGFGTLVPDERSVPLIRLRSLAQANVDGGQPLSTSPTIAGDVLYLSALGRGRICCFNMPGKTPKVLQDATGNRFVARAVRWLADRPVD